MFGFTSPRPRPGRPMLAAAASRPVDYLARLVRSRYGPGLATRAAAGSDLPYSTARRRWTVRLTSVGASAQAGSYGWQAVVPDPDTPGGWLDVAGWSGALAADPAWEDNLVHTLSVGDRVDVTREWASQRVRFQFDKCS